MLWSQNWTRPRNSNPTYEWFSGYLVLFHRPKAYQCACSSEAGFTMNSYGSTIWCGEVFSGHLKKLFNYIVWWSWSINEEQIIVNNLIFFKVLLVILRLIKSNNSLNTKLLKNLNVLLWVMAIPLICISLFNRTHEGHEFSRDNPIYITIFNSFVVLIFFYVEGTEVVPFVFDSVLQSLKALE